MAKEFIITAPILSILASSDYIATAQNITLDAGSTEEVFFSVSILNDTTVEESIEHFFAVLSAAADESGVEIGRRGNATVNIQDDDGTL